MREWRFYTAKELGKRHELRNMLCQDRSFIRSRNHKYIGVLVDGIGQTNLNIVGAEMAAQCTAKYMEENFEDLLKDDPAVIADEFMGHINQELQEIADLCKKPVKEFASTIMAFCVDEEQDKYVTLHLGDGVILYKRNNGQMRVLSFPEIGFYSVRTTLTTTKGAERRLFVKRGCAETIEQIALMTDGIYRSSPSPERFEEIFKTVEMNIPLEQGIDDQSVVILSRVKDGADSVNIDFMNREEK